MSFCPIWILENSRVRVHSTILAGFSRKQEVKSPYFRTVYIRAELVFKIGDINMADGITTALNGNPVRQGTTVFNANRFGVAAKLNSVIIPTGSINSLFESNTTNRFNNSLSMFQDYVTIASSGAEASWTVPEGANKFLFKCRTQNDIQFGYNSGSASGVAHTTLFGGTAYESPDSVDFRANQSLYFTGASGLVVEINYWR
jgi:hypothetical protein